MSSPFTIRFPVRFRDIDALGHVNNAVYFTYMESARTDYWMKTFGVDALPKLGFIVAHAECDFRVPARYGDEIEVALKTSSVRNSSFIWEYEIRNAVTSEIFAVGKTIQVYYDYSKLKSAPVPEEVRQKLLA
jgi:acyl-CoA thioester hydrolase